METTETSQVKTLDQYKAENEKLRKHITNLASELAKAIEKIWELQLKGDE